MKSRAARVRRFFAILLCVAVSAPARSARADFFGGDLPLLIQIVANTFQEIAHLQAILGNGSDTLGLLRDINQGIKEAMSMMRTMNGTLQPGVLSQLQNPEDMLRAIQGIYGTIPRTPESRTQAFTDQSVAEAITLHNQAFAYADKVDPEAERIKDYSRGVSPTGAGRLTAESLGVLINVTNQVLRTNAAMLKIMSANLALQNRREKVSSEQFRMQYEGLSQAIAASPSFKEETRLNP